MNLVFSSGENSKSRTSVRKVDCLTKFPVQADLPRVHETGANRSNIAWQNCEMDGRALMMLSIAGAKEMLDGISIVSGFM
jgi:hypothetical protein